jgi:hypothetical protein
MVFVVLLFFLQLATCDTPAPLDIGKTYNITLSSNQNKNYTFSIKNALSPESNLFITTSTLYNNPF